MNPLYVERRDERGAALITMLLVSMLLLVAGGALVVSTSMSAQASFDSTAEVQAYYGAEAGVQATLNVLRGNVAPNPLFATNPTGGVNTLNKLDFLDAVTLLRANKSGDTSTTSRLSRWLSYDATYTDRVIVYPTASYTPLSGVAYSVVVTDPDAATTAVGAEPSRLLVTVTGYGPRGARKQLEVVVRRSAFDIDPPATITVAGGATMNFNLGSSNASGYNGNDFATPPQPTLPAVAVSAPNVATAQLAMNGLNGVSGSSPPTVCLPGSQVYPCSAGTLDSTNTPSFLASADAARGFLYTAMLQAQSLNRYYTTQPSTSNMGTSTSPQFTFIDNYGGDPVTLGPGYQGCGLLIVTGQLDTNGNTDFDGIILVLGTGIMTRSGGGNGVIAGSIMVASFDPAPTATTGFTAPTFTVNGGGNSDVRFDSDEVNKALKSAGRVVLGIVEK